MKKIIMILFLIMFTYSCKMFIFGSDTYVINRFLESEEIIYGIRMNGFKQVKVLNENSIQLYDTAITGLALPKETQMMWDFGVDFTKKTILNVYLRTTSTDFLNNKDNVHLKFDSENNTFSYFEDNQLIKSLPYDFNNELRRIKIENYSNNVKVSIDLDDILTYKTEKQNTEYIIFHNEKLDTLEINAISVIKHYK